MSYLFEVIAIILMDFEINFERFSTFFMKNCIKASYLVHNSIIVYCWSDIFKSNLIINQNKRENLERMKLWSQMKKFGVWGGHGEEQSGDKMKSIGPQEREQNFISTRLLENGGSMALASTRWVIGDTLKPNQFYETGWESDKCGAFEWLCPHITGGSRSLHRQMAADTDS